MHPRTPQRLKFGVCFLDENVDELEEELKALLAESKPDSISDLPAVPTNGLRPSGEPILSSLPDVPHSHLSISTDKLEEELNRLSLSGTGSYVLEFSACLSVYQLKVTYDRLSAFRLSAEESNVPRQEVGADAVMIQRRPAGKSPSAHPGNLLQLMHIHQSKNIALINNWKREIRL